MRQMMDVPEPFVPACIPTMTAQLDPEGTDEGAPESPGWVLFPGPNRRVRYDVDQQVDSPAGCQHPPEKLVGWKLHRFFDT